MGAWTEQLHTRMQSPRAFHRALLVLVATALLARVAAVFVVNDWHAPEDWEYGDIARNILAGKGFSGSAWLVPEGPTAFMAPAYVYFLAAAYAVLGDAAYLPVQLLQAAAGALGVALLALATRRMLGNAAALGAAAILALNPTHAYLASQVHPLALLATLLPAVLLCALRVGERPSTPRALTLGGLIGLNMLTDPAIACWAPVLGLYPVIVHRKQWRRGLIIAALTTAAACAVVAPWTVRNYLVFERFILVKSQAGFILWVGNHEGATGTQTLLGPEGLPINANDHLDPALRSELRALGEPEAYHELGRIARAHMVAHPTETIARSLRKAAFFWWFPDWLVNPQDAQQPWLSPFRHPQNLVWAFVLGLAALGLAQRRRAWRYWALPVTALICYTTLYAVTNVGSNARYRIPVEPIVMVFSGAGLVRLAGVTTPQRDEGN